MDYHAPDPGRDKSPANHLIIEPCLLVIKEDLKWHPGGNLGFIAQVIVDPNRKNAILVVTNVRASYKPLFKAMSRIKEHYLSIADLPGIK